MEEEEEREYVISCTWSKPHPPNLKSKREARREKVIAQTLKRHLPETVIP